VRVHDWTVVRCAAMSHRCLVLLLVCLGWLHRDRLFGWLHGDRLFGWLHGDRLFGWLHGDRLL
jgi:hypothetical protein